MSAPGRRIVAIDMLKGAAIVCVMLIHAEALPGSFAMVHLINHAVPVFVVLSGLNSELWWDGRTTADLGTWLRTRARRLYVPVWAMLAVWWAVALWFPQPFTPLSWSLALSHAAGDLRFVDTGWFVTMIVQLVLLFPILHFAARRLGDGPVLVAGLACLLASVAWRFELLSRLGYYGLIVFSPRMLGHLAFGMVLAHHLDRLTWRTALLAMALVVPGWAVHAGVAAPALGDYAAWLVDLPLTVALLVVMGGLARFDRVARPFAWLGVHSWGLYLGQILVIAAITFPLGRRWALDRLDPFVHASLLLAGAIALVLAGTALLATVERRVAGVREPAAAP